MASPLAIDPKISRMAAGVIAAIGMTIAPAYAGVGVTSGTDGDPLGRPPSQAERVLRVGVDIQANEAITTKENDRAHILFLDGTSLTVAPNAQLVIDKYVYDPNTKTGDIAVSVSKGVFRLVGGKISKNTPMVVNTPAATIGIRGGIGVIVAEPNRTQANFLFGTSMTVTANGRTETARRPGSQIVTSLGGVPSAPAMIPAGGLTGQLASLEGRTSKDDRKADEAAKGSGFSSANSGQAVAVPVAPRSLSLQAANNVAAQAVSNTNTERQPLADTGSTLTIVTAAPQLAAAPRGTALPPSPSLPAPPQIVSTTPSVTPVPSSPAPQAAGAITPTVVVVLPPISRPDFTPVAGVGSGSLVPPPTTTVGTGAVPKTTTPTITTPTITTPTITTPTITTPTTTTPTTSPTTVTPTNKPPTTPTTTPITVKRDDDRRATPAVGVGNGGLVLAVPPTISRGRR